MALDPSTEFTGKITAPDANYPYGSARDITVPGDGTGTPWLASLVNDIFGFQQAILNAASIVPSGSPDTILASDYLDGIDIIKARLANTQKLVGRNFADTLFRDLIGLNASDIIELGNSTSSVEMLSTSFQVNGNMTFQGGTGSGRLRMVHTGGTDHFADFEQFAGWGRRMKITSSTVGIGLDVTNIAESAGLPLVMQTSGGITTFGGMLKRGTVTTITPDTGADDIVIDTGGTVTGMTIISGTTGNIFFGNGADADDGRISYDHSGKDLNFYTAGVLRVTFGLGLIVGSPTGGDKGAGSLNTQSLYIQGVALSSNKWTKHPTVHTGVSSGTSIAWTAIPSWVTSIKIVYADHSWNGGADIALRLGDSGGFETTGYSGRASKTDIGTNWSTQAIISKSLVAGDISNGEIHIVNITGNQWGINSTGLTETGQFFLAGGAKSTSGVMDRVQIISEDGTSTFDGGGNYALYYQ